MVVGIIIAADITAETIKYERIILLKDETLFQAMFAGALGALAAYFNILLIPLTVLIAVMIVDYFTGMASAKVTGELSYWFGMIITVWLIINELISILENLGEIGVPLPEFLVNAVKSLKNKVDGGDK